jgi:hypothetical protein
MKKARPGRAGPTTFLAGCIVDLNENLGWLERQWRRIWRYFLLAQMRKERSLLRRAMHALVPLADTPKPGFFGQ